jgi:hypothetical protein
MADSELGEVRRPQRTDLERVLRATGYRSQGMAGGTTDTVSPLDESDDSGLTADGSSDDGADSPSWFAETTEVVATTSNVVLTYSPIDFSEVLRLNGVVMVRGVDYTITGRTVTLTDPDELLAGIDSSTWTIEATYPYFDAAFDQPTFTTYAASQAILGRGEVTLSGAPAVGDVAVLVARGHLTGFTGGFATWVKVRGEATAEAVALWLGLGVGTGTTVTHTATGSATHDGQFVIAVVPDVAGVSVASWDTDDLVAGPPPTPAVTPTAAAIAGQLVVTAVVGENDGLDSYHPDTTHTDIGFTGTLVKSVKGVFYGQGVGMSIGYADEDSDVSTEFDMVITGTDGYGQSAVAILVVD